MQFVHLWKLTQTAGCIWTKRNKHVVTSESLSFVSHLMSLTPAFFHSLCYQAAKINFLVLIVLILFFVVFFSEDGVHTPTPVGDQNLFCRVKKVLISDSNEACGPQYLEQTFTESRVKFCLHDPCVHTRNNCHEKS